MMRGHESRTDIASMTYSNVKLDIWTCIVTDFKIHKATWFWTHWRKYWVGGLEQSEDSLMTGFRCLSFQFSLLEPGDLLSKYILKDLSGTWKDSR